MRVLVSSTCFDLIDLRAVVEDHIRSMGLTPMLSDSATSDFEVHHDRDSIATCLANVQSADHVIVILSKRYGPPINLGYGPYSATHLEYREAVKLGKPISFYVRDKLAGEYETWSKMAEEDRSKLPLRWSGKTDGPRLFEFIDERKPLTDSTRNNWFEPFKDVRVVKSLISRDFKVEANKISLRRLIENGQIPTFSFSPSHTNGIPEITLHLHGNLTAINAFWRVKTEHENPWNWLGNVAPASDLRFVAKKIQPRSAEPDQTFLLRYESMFGQTVEDTIALSGQGSEWTVKLVRRRLLDPAYEMG